MFKHTKRGTYKHINGNQYDQSNTLHTRQTQNTLKA